MKIKVFKQQVKWNQLFQCILLHIGECLGFQGLRDFFQMFRGVASKSNKTLFTFQFSCESKSKTEQSQIRIKNRYLCLK